MKSNATALAVVLLGLICLVGIVSVVECANSATDSENLANVLSQSLRRKHTVAKRLQGKLQTKHHARVQKAMVKVKSFVQDIVRPFLNTVMRVAESFKQRFADLLGTMDRMRTEVTAMVTGWRTNLQAALQQVRGNAIFRDLPARVTALMNQVKTTAESPIDTGLAALGSLWSSAWDSITSVFRFRQRDFAMVLANHATRQARGEEGSPLQLKAHRELEENLYMLRMLGGEHGEKLVDGLYHEAGKLVQASLLELNAELDLNRHKQMGALTRILGADRARSLQQAVTDMWSRSRNPFPEMFTTGVTGQVSVAYGGFEMTFDTYKHQMQVWALVGVLLGTSAGSASVNIYKGIGYKGPSTGAVRDLSLSDACRGWCMGGQGGISIPVTGLGPLQISLGASIATSAVGPAIASVVPNTSGIQNLLARFSITPGRGCSFAALSAGVSAGLGKGAVPMTPSPGGDAFVAYYEPLFGFNCATLGWRRPSICSAILMLMIPGAIVPPFESLMAGYTIILANTGLVSRALGTR